MSIYLNKTQKTFNGASVITYQIPQNYGLDKEDPVFDIKGALLPSCSTHKNIKRINQNIIRETSNLMEMFSNKKLLQMNKKLD